MVVRIRKLPYLRCPCCGKLSLFRNFLGFHKVDAMSCTTKGLGRGKGFKNVWVNESVKGNLIQYWIKRLQEVIEYLEKINPKPAKLTNVVTSRPLETSCSIVSEMSVSPLIKTVTVQSPLTLTETQTLNVPKCSVKLSQH
jgi:hypothetical protein